MARQQEEVTNPPLDVDIGQDRRLRLSFVWAEDRYAHRLEWQQGQQTVAALETVPVVADEIWPRNPPLQQLSVEGSSDNHPVALLMGMAARSHWSVSVETVAGRGWLFDVACRCLPGPEWLGSTYQWIGGDLSLAGDVAGFGQADPRPEIRLLPIEGEPVPSTTVPRMAMRHNQLIISAALPSQDSPTTVRWKYLAQWSSMAPRV